MFRLLANKLAAMVVTLAVSSVIIFAALYAAPGDPLAFLLGNRTISPDAEQALRNQFYLNDPAFERFFRWLGGLLSGGLGQSIIHQQSVASLLAPRVVTTLLLTGYAALIIVVFGVGLGLLAALRRGATDTALLLITSVFMAVPSFVAAIVFISVFAVQLGWFPVFGPGSGFIDEVYHLTMPAIALALASTAYVARVARTALREEMDREHVQTAIGRGIPYWTVMRRHVLRNGLLPITTVCAVTIIGLISGSVVVEQAFGLDGIGSLLVQSVQTHDFSVVQSICLIYVTVVVLISSLVDLSYPMLDPRVRR